MKTFFSSGPVQTGAIAKKKSLGTLATQAAPTTLHNNNDNSFIYPLFLW